MAGAYCKFCGRRCFVERILPAGPHEPRRLHMATCPAGMEHDRKATGYDQTTAINPHAPSQPTGPVDREWSIGQRVEFDTADGSGQGVVTGLGTTGVVVEAPPMPDGSVSIRWFFGREWAEKNLSEIPEGDA